MKALKIQSEIEGKGVIEMELKETYELEECEVGRIIMLNLIDGETWTGIFKGMDGAEVMVSSLSSSNIIGLPTNVINDYFEEI